MHELLKHVLTERDLTRAGDIFAIPDSDIVDDLNEVLKQITDISSRPDYIRNDRDQALIEICVTRVTSCIKETGTLQKYCGALVALLESCLHHNLMPVGHLRDDDPPHAKIASDVIACIVLVSFPLQADKETSGNADVMELFLPVAVQFLHKGNREISRHMARYLSLAAVHHAVLLKPHVQTIMDSIMSGNYPLCRILTNLYEVCPEPLEGHVTALVSLLPHAEPVEKSSLFALFEQIAARRPEALKTAIPQLLSYLCPNTASQNDPGCMCIDLLQVVARVSRSRASLVSEHTAAVRRASRAPHATPRVTELVATILATLGYTSREHAQEALNFVVERLSGAEWPEQAALIREATALCSAYPALFTDRLLAALRANHSNRPKSTHGEVNRTPGGVTIVKLGGQNSTTTANTPVSVGSTVSPTVTTAPVSLGSTVTPVSTSVAPVTGYTRRAKLGDSRSTGRLHPGPNSHRSMTRLNVAGGSVGGLHKSMTRLSSSQQINAQQNMTPPIVGSKPTVAKAGSGGAVTVTTISPPLAPRVASRHHHHNIIIGPNTATNSGPTVVPGPPSLPTQSISVNPLTGKSSDALIPTSVSIQHSNTALGQVSVITSTPSTGPVLTQTCGSGPIAVGPNPMPIGPVTVTSRRANNTSVTMINSSNSNNSNSNHRISVFEPYPMRDTVQHFCEKHLDKIKAYMDNVSLRIPPPAKCTIEERRSKKQARLSFACGRRGPHCLYARAAFSMRTRAPRVWIHLMFLALQARHAAALSSRDPTVASLKHCWDILKCENKTFLTLVTGAFPGLKEQEMLLNELRAAGFFDVFEVNSTRTDGASVPPTQATWGCFLCNHPERAVGFLAADGQPVIEGQLKEKKGRWRLFRRWRTRYFTLSGAHLSCKGASGGESIDINQIRSVKVSRGARNIPKAFEIFTGDQTLILKPKDGKNAEEWAQCLSIAVAHSQARDAPAKANSLPARGLTLKSF
ncbi:protein melted isoform X1 [Maniola hyperantus]|uniref:protein melted isoform X1 n=1 Tax=Aphantopus hyperantus TaxID=2795564 RepID=UPI001568CBD4|nr:protein melted [Maniola hyperantus]